MNVIKFETLRKTLLLSAATIFVWWAWKAPAQDAATINASARVPYAVSQVVELEQAKIGEGTVIAYIRNSGNNYNLTANDILYLHQQGVSDAVLTAMLTQSRASVANVAMPGSYSPPVAPAPQYSAPASAPDASAYANYADTAPATVVQPTTTYVQAAPTTYYYPYSNYYPYSYSYPYYGYYGYYGSPGWGWGWWGGGWHWGWGGHGGWNAGWHGGWGGGGFHGVVGGGFHGGGGGGFHGGGGGGFHGGGGHR
jgi:uncharacterized membrane protein YgcG